MSNENTKYRLNKSTYEVKQNERHVSDYYTNLRVLWEDIESMNDYLPITNVNSEITTFIEAIDQQKEEHKLIQFLNGLDLGYGALRSQIMLMCILPTVETVVSMVQQEKSHNEVLGKEKEESAGITLYSKNENKPFSTVCKKTNHTAEKCWFKIGFPSGNDKNNQNNNFENVQEKGWFHGKKKEVKDATVATMQRRKLVIMVR